MHHLKIRKIFTVVTSLSLLFAPVSSFAAVGDAPVHVGFTSSIKKDVQGQLGDQNKRRLVKADQVFFNENVICLLYTSPSPRDGLLSRMPSSA